ncbi:MAG TPA: SDR family oxidoreductase [Mycobacteriales bacterium]|nr:SDR family oxidoreductase [Mycobacteriales bacterium]
MDLGFDGAATAVVGGTKGLGLATAELLAREGARVAVIARDDAGLEAAEVRLRAAGCRDAVRLRADIAVPEDVDAAFGELERRWGELNALVVSPGLDTAGRAEALAAEDWTTAMRAGALGPAQCVLAALPLLRAAAWARVVTVTAMSVKRQSPGLISYTAAKSALASITKNLARSLAADGILVNAVAPGPMLTGWVESALGVGAGELTPVDAFRRLGGAQSMHVDLARLAAPDEVAAVVAFCASRTNSFMTGAHLNVDGGSDFC